MPPMHTARIFAGAVQFKAMDVYVFCGTTNGYQSGALASIEHFKATSNKWTIFFIDNTPKWLPRYGVGALNLSATKNIIIYGGKEPVEGGKTPTNFLFNPGSKILVEGQDCIRQPEQETEPEESYHRQESRILEEFMQEQAEKQERLEQELQNVKRPHIKSDTTHSDMSLSTRITRSKRVMRRVSNSPTCLRLLSGSPYLKHLSKQSEEYKQITDEFKCTPSNQSRASTTFRLDESASMGRVVRSNSKDLNVSGQSRYLSPKALGNSMFSPISAHHISTALSPIREKSEKASHRNSMDMTEEGARPMAGLMGYCSPVVPIIQLGIHLTISRTLKGSGAEEYELCWFDGRDERWKIGADWLAQELDILYTEHTLAEESTYLNRLAGGGGESGISPSQLGASAEYTHFKQGLEGVEVHRSFYEKRVEE